MRKQIITFLFIFTSVLCGSSFVASAQSKFNSPYSYLGIGKLNDDGNVNSMSMSGLGAGLINFREINYLNPASLTSLNITTYEIGVGGRFLNVTDGNVNVNSNSSSFEYVSLAFPMRKINGAANFGYRKLSNVGYSFFEETTNDSLGVVLNTFEGEGGLNKFNYSQAFTYKFKPADFPKDSILTKEDSLKARLDTLKRKHIKQISVGATANYIFGKISHDQTLSFDSTLALPSATYLNSVFAQDFSFEFGTQLKYIRIFNPRKPYIKAKDSTNVEKRLAKEKAWKIKEEAWQVKEDARMAMEMTKYEEAVKNSEGEINAYKEKLKQYDVELAKYREDLKLYDENQKEIADAKLAAKDSTYTGPKQVVKSLKKPKMPSKPKKPNVIEKPESKEMKEKDFGPQPRKVQEISFILGGTYSPGYKLGADNLHLRTLNNGDENLDTIAVSEDEANGAITMPAKFTIGLTAEINKKFTIGFDYRSTQWNSFSNPLFDESGAYQLTNSNKMILGAQYKPATRIETHTKLWEATSYRVGVSMGNSEIISNGTQLMNYGTSFGLGIPLRKFASFIAIGYKFGVLSAGSNSGLLNETYHRITLGITFNEKWFIKRKYD